MAGLFGNTWISGYGASPSGVGADTWASALVGLTPMQIARGLQETLVLGSDFPPSAPRFRSLCLQIPTLAIVRASIRSGKRDPFTILVLSRLDQFQHRHADQRAAAEMVREAYEVARDHVMRGGDLPDVPVAELAAPIPPKRERCTPEKARGYVDEIQSLLGIGAVDDTAAPNEDSELQ